MKIPLILVVNDDVAYNYEVFEDWGWGTEESYYVGYLCIPL